MLNIPFQDFLTNGMKTPSADAKQNFVLKAATEDAGMNTLEFSRKRVTGDSQDIDIQVMEGGKK